MRMEARIPYEDYQEALLYIGTLKAILEEALELLRFQVMVLDQLIPLEEQYNALVPEEVRVDLAYARKHQKSIEAFLAGQKG